MLHLAIDDVTPVKEDREEKAATCRPENIKVAVAAIIIVVMLAMLYIFFFLFFSFLVSFLLVPLI